MSWKMKHDFYAPFKGVKTPNEIIISKRVYIMIMYQLPVKFNRE